MGVISVDGKLQRIRRINPKFKIQMPKYLSFDIWAFIFKD